jgi:hypothetical protein
MSINNNRHYQHRISNLIFQIGMRESHKRTHPIPGDFHDHRSIPFPSGSNDPHSMLNHGIRETITTRISSDNRFFNNHVGDYFQNPGFGKALTIKFPSGIRGEYTGNSRCW